MRKNEFIKKMEDKFGSKYGYSLLPDIILSKDKVDLICPIHGVFNQRCDMWLFKGCSLCNIEKNSLSREEFIKKGEEKHKNSDGTPKYGYEKVIYTGYSNKVIITCPIHGDFEQIVGNHLTKSGCPQCAGNKKFNTETYIKKGEQTHKNSDETPLYTYTKTVVTNGNKEKIIITCPKHGDFEQRADSHLCNTGGPSGCPQCYNELLISKQEKELFNFINKLDNISFEIKASDRTILNGEELDIYIPEKKIAFEYNGLYWHSELKKDNNYHIRKTEKCLEQGIRLIHIFEDEWINKTEIVKSRIANLLDVTKFHSYARKCDIKLISTDEAKLFLERHHIQGSCNSSVQIGLFQKDKLLAVMTFGQLRKNLGSSYKEGSYELLRFCNFQNLNIVGGASKLLKYFIKHYTPKEIISYCDRRWSDGNLYEKIGFTFSHNSKPNYFYIDGQKRINRYNYRKDILVSKYGCKSTDTEKNFCFEHGWYRIYDCGTKVYKMIL